MSCHTYTAYYFVLDLVWPWRIISPNWAELFSNLPKSNDCVPMIVGPVLTGSVSCMEVDFSCCAHSINNIYIYIYIYIYIHHICAIYREILFIQHNPQFCYLLITPLLLCRSSLHICLTVRCSSSWNVLHEHTAANFYWHSSGQGHYCACGTVMWPTSRDDHGCLRWPVLPAWKHEWFSTPCNKAQFVYVCIFFADVGGFCPDYQDGAGCRHLTSVRPRTLTQTFVLSVRVCLPHCLLLRVSNVMVIRQYYNDQFRTLSLKLTAAKFRRFLHSWSVLSSHLFRCT